MLPVNNTATICFYPLCPQHGERPAAVDPRDLDVRCDECGRLLDSDQPRLVTTPEVPITP